MPRAWHHVVHGVTPQVAVVSSYYCSVGVLFACLTWRWHYRKYHEFVLHMDGKGGYSFSPIDGVEVFGS